MQRVRYKYGLKSAYLLLLLVSLFVDTVSAQSKPQVPEDYQKLFVHYVDNRTISEKALNLVNITRNDVGRSFALIAGVSRYPNMSLTNQELQPAAEDIKKLQEYLTTYEFFDEIVVLKDGDVTTENLEFFLQTYYSRRLKKFPKSRFIFAYSGHGMTEGASGYLLKNTARSLTDKANSINLGVVRVFVDEVVKSGHHVLVLLNACYSGAFLRRSFGGPKKFISRNRGAHAITAGGTGEQTWHIPAVGKGSVFFEKVFAGLDQRADSSGDGLIGVYELFSYLKQEVQIFTDQDQNPQVGDLTIHGSKGEFFFLNRDRQVSEGVLPEWKPETATPFGIKAEEALIKGQKYYSAAKYGTALSWFHKAAEAGNEVAMGNLGHMYRDGQGVTQDYAEAVRWHRKAIEAGYVNAMNNLGLAYKHGRGVAQDYAEAVHWFHKAAEAGDAQAMNNLGLAYDNGQGVAQNYAEAVRWYRKAVEAGFDMAMNNLGLAHKHGRGVAQDYAEAVRLFSKAAEAGDVNAMNNLGHLYRKGQGVAQNYAEAVHWYRKAAETGDTNGMYLLGYLYRKGRGVTQDFAEALHWFHKAAEAGNAEAMSNLGWMYQEGQGVAQDYAEAVRWYRKAAEAGNEYALKRLKDLDEELDIRDITKSQKVRPKKDFKSNEGLCSKYGSLSRQLWRESYLHETQYETWHVFILTLSPSQTQKDAVRLAEDYKQKYPNHDFNIMPTVSRKNTNRRWAIVIAEGLWDASEAKEIAKFARQCGIARDAFAFQQRGFIN